MSYFYKLYAPLLANRQQPADDFEEDLYKQIFSELKIKNKIVYTV